MVADSSDERGIEDGFLLLLSNHDAQRRLEGQGVAPSLEDACGLSIQIRIGFLLRRVCFGYFLLNRRKQGPSSQGSDGMVCEWDSLHQLDLNQIIAPLAALSSLWRDANESERPLTSSPSGLRYLLDMRDG